MRSSRLDRLHKQLEQLAEAQPAVHQAPGILSYDAEQVPTREEARGAFFAKLAAQVMCSCGQARCPNMPGVRVWLPEKAPPA